MQHRFLFLLLNLRLRLPKLFHPLQLFLGIIESDMCVHIHCDRYIRMPHEVLQRLWIHSRFCHIRAIGVSAYMRRNVWHLHPVNVIVSANHMIESVLPVHCHKWHSRMKEYVHHFIVFAYYPNFNCNPSNKSPIVQLRCSSDSGSAYLAISYSEFSSSFFISAPVFTALSSPS